MSELIASLRQHRECWRLNTFNLESHVLLTLEQLFGTDIEIASSSLFKATLLVAQSMEMQARDHIEPKYHNRLHTADVLSAMATMLSIESVHGSKPPGEFAQLLLLSAVAHDYKHPGGMNKHPFELERQSVMQLEGIWTNCALSVTQINQISQLILHTDISTVQSNHDRVKGQHFAFNLDWAQVLLNEADIMASCTPEFGPELSRQLAQEWRETGYQQYADVDTDEGRQQFLKSVRFSSPASVTLGFPQMVVAQLKKL